jgi:hypothetical protein
MRLRILVGLAAVVTVPFATISPPAAAEPRYCAAAREVYYWMAEVMSYPPAWEMDAATKRQQKRAMDRQTSAARRTLTLIRADRTPASRILATDWYLVALDTRPPQFGEALNASMRNVSSTMTNVCRIDTIP